MQAITVPILTNAGIVDKDQPIGDDFCFPESDGENVETSPDSPKLILRDVEAFDLT